MDLSEAELNEVNMLLLKDGMYSKFIYKTRKRVSDETHTSFTKCL